MSIEDHFLVCVFKHYFPINPVMYLQRHRTENDNGMRVPMPNVTLHTALLALLDRTLSLESNCAKSAGFHTDNSLI